MIFSTIIRALITMKVKTVEILIAAAATNLVHITSDKNPRLRDSYSKGRN